jgi:mannose-6-phosphate isomerase-like protein (cupin superfamily)
MANEGIKSIRPWFLTTEVTIRVSENEGGDGISVLDHRARFGDSPPLHRHVEEDEIFHIISGRLRFVVGGKELRASVGETLRAPKCPSGEFLNQVNQL